MEPAWELARYQHGFRALLQPNPRQEFRGRRRAQIRSFSSRQDGGKYVELREVKRATHVTKYGPVLVKPCGICNELLRQS